MCKILVVDDEKFVRDKIARTLTKNGYKVDLASEGNEALFLIHNNKYDVIIMDIFMPSKGGIETLIELRSKFENEKVIIISGKAPEEKSAFQRLINQYGASIILHKPFKKNELLGAINSILSN